MGHSRVFEAGPTGTAPDFFPAGIGIGRAAGTTVDQSGFNGGFYGCVFAVDGGDRVAAAGRLVNYLFTTAWAEERKTYGYHP